MCRSQPRHRPICPAPQRRDRACGRPSPCRRSATGPSPRGLFQAQGPAQPWAVLGSWRYGKQTLGAASAVFARLRMSVTELGLDGIDVGCRHLGNSRDFAVLDAPEPEGAGYVAILVE